jgi:RNase P subunit RPR2
MSFDKATVRPAERKAFCRLCDKTIQKGQEMISWYTIRGQSSHIILCLPCGQELGEMAKEAQ